MTWTKYIDSSEKLVEHSSGRLVGVTWYHEGAHLWRVTWDGWMVKTGTGCIDSAEARREADLIIDACLCGEINPPWKKSAVYEDAKQKLEAAREAAGVKKQWGYYP